MVWVFVSVAIAQQTILLPLYTVINDIDPMRRLTNDKKKKIKKEATSIASIQM